jgi:pyruvate dehydrogenase E2 component (dihydrolipoamide acetyltransferase)
MGSELIYAPFPTILKIPLILVMNSIKDDVVVEDGKLGIDKVMTVAITVDHRFIDGVHALAAQNHLQKVLEDPEKYLNI